jgi:hypothetical protein
VNPVTKTLLIIVGSIVGTFLVPFILIVFHDYLNAFFAIFLFILNFLLFGYYAYIDFYPVLLKRHLEEEDIIHQFHGDPNKIRFYKGFKKYFDGDLNEEGLKNWLIHHQVKH